MFKAMFQVQFRQIFSSKQRDFTSNAMALKVREYSML